MRYLAATFAFPVSFCILAAAAAFCSGRSDSPTDLKARELSPAEVAVVNSPFAPVSSLKLLKSELAHIEALHKSKLLLPSIAPQGADAASMGWNKSDRDYWNAIPEDAKTIPPDWSDFAGVSYTNPQLGGTRQVRLAVGSRYDQWLLKDPRHKLFACISVERSTKRVYFMEVGRSKSSGSAGQWVYHAAFDNCYSCHPSGPRVIRPLDSHGVDRSLLAKLNQRILSYGACDFVGAIDLNRRGEPFHAAACAACHDGKDRGILYEINRPTIQFKRELEKTMPPE